MPDIPITAQDEAASMACPAMLTNRFFAGVGPAGMRLAFAEQNGLDKPAHVRAAVVMSVQDALMLKDLLVRILKDIEPESRDAE